MGSSEDTVVRVLKGDHLVALIRERPAGLFEIAHDLLGAVVDVTRGDQLIACMIEGGEGRIELVAVLRIHVLPDDGLALAADGGGGWHRGDSTSGPLE
jgi:hypothetical protein